MLLSCHRDPGPLPPFSPPTHSTPPPWTRAVKTKSPGAKDVEAPWTCDYTVYGCTVKGADNYAPYATNIAGMCQYGGCNDTEASNYNPTATYNNGACTYPLIGCTVSPPLDSPRGAPHARPSSQSARGGGMREWGQWVGGRRCFSYRMWGAQEVEGTMKIPTDALVGKG